MLHLFGPRQMWSNSEAIFKVSPNILCPEVIMLWLSDTSTEEEEAYRTGTTIIAVSPMPIMGKVHSLRGFPLGRLYFSIKASLQLKKPKNAVNPMRKVPTTA